MTLALTELLLLMGGFLIIAILYSSVGFGGGSSYLAILALVFVSFFSIRSTALICNIMVVSGSTYLYWKKGHIDFKKFVPLIITSIPMAFIGAQFRLSENVFFILLGIALMVSAMALIYQSLQSNKPIPIATNYPPYITYLLGAGIGLLSGLVGIGGGIFLAPILNHMRWNTSIKIAALASFFILVNSISSIGGLFINDSFEFPLIEGLALMLAVFIGGQIGVRLSLNKLTGMSIKIITAILVLIVGLRILLTNGLQLKF